MPRRIATSFLPRLLEKHDYEPTETTAVVIDILRASTTMVTALANGAREIVPCLEIEEALELRRAIPEALLGGERGGSPIKGFDCSNSPVDYGPERVDGRPVIFTTTNGTRALSHVTDCQQVVVGAFVNFRAVCDVLQDGSQVLLLCAGTNGAITREDVLFAGAVVDELVSRNPDATVDDESRLAAAAWRQIAGLPGDVCANLAETLKQTSGGENLLRLGYDSDLPRVASIDRYSILPRWDSKSRTVRVP